MTAISILGSGGTIAAAPTTDGAAPGVTTRELVEQVAVPGVSITSRDVLQTSSRAMTPALMLRLAEAVLREVRDGADGVVVTHGTDTLEETAYALALLLDTTVPVVLTGAMRPPYRVGNDGPANLLGAVVCATDPALAAYGPVVVHQDEVHVARWVSKVHSARVAAFASPQTGPVGAVVEDRLVLLAGPPPGIDRLPGTAELSAGQAPTARVEILWAAAGSDGAVVDAIGPMLDGLVVAGTGGGHVSPPLAEALARLSASGCPVILSSRCAAPQVLAHSYAGSGSETDLLAAGLLPGGSLTPIKARLRLIFGLAAGLVPADLFVDGHGRL